MTGFINEIRYLIKIIHLIFALYYNILIRLLLIKCYFGYTTLKPAILSLIWSIPSCHIMSITKVMTYCVIFILAMGRSFSYTALYQNLPFIGTLIML